MSWAEIKKINSDLNVPLNERIDTKTTEINTRVGQAGDAANVAGSLHAKAGALLRRWAVASDTVQASSTASKIGTSGVVKSFSSLVGGTVRIKYTAYCNGGTWTLTYGPGFGGGAVTLGSGANTSAQSFSVDVKVPPGGLIILTGSATSSANIYLSNVYLCFSLSGDQTLLATNLID